MRLWARFDQREKVPHVFELSEVAGIDVTPYDFRIWRVRYNGIRRVEGELKKKEAEMTKMAAKNETKGEQGRTHGYLRGVRGGWGSDRIALPSNHLGRSINVKCPVLKKKNTYQRFHR